MKAYRRVAFRGGVLRVLLGAVAAVQPEDAFYVSYGQWPRFSLPQHKNFFLWCVRGPMNADQY